MSPGSSDATAGGVEAPAGANPPPAAPAEICDRCGAFAELFPREDGRFCADCLERLKRPIERGEITVGSVFAGTWMLMKAAGPKSLLVLVAFSAPFVAMLVAWPEHPTLLGLAYAPVFLIVNVTIFGLCQASVEPGGQVQIGPALSRTVRRFWPLFAVDLMVAIAVNLGTLLLVVPGIILGLSFFVALPIVLHEDLRGVEAIGASYDRMKGHRLVTFVTILVAKLPQDLAFFAREFPRYVWLFHHPGLHLPPATGLVALGLRLLGVLCAILPLFLVATLYAMTRHRVPPPPPPDDSPPEDPVDHTGDDDGDGITELEPWELRAPAPAKRS